MQAKDAIDNGPALWALPPLREGDHKYHRGHVALMGGAMTGAAKLAALAAQRAGAGVVTLASNRETWPIYAASMASVITRPVDSVQDWSALLRERKVNTVVLGPGMTPDATLADAIHAAQAEQLPMILDAGALELLAGSAPVRHVVEGSGAILTPHEGEYRKLASTYKLDTAAIKPARACGLAKATGCIVLLKGDVSIIAAPDGMVVRNRASAPQLASAGTGDVLAGMIAGLLAQGMRPFYAACAAAYLHAKAAQCIGRGLIAEDLIAALPSMFGR